MIELIRSICRFFYGPVFWIWILSMIVLLHSVINNTGETTNPLLSFPGVICLSLGAVFSILSFIKNTVTPQGFGTIIRRYLVNGTYNGRLVVYGSNFKAAHRQFDRDASPWQDVFFIALHYHDKRRISVLRKLYSFFAKGFLIVRNDSVCRITSSFWVIDYVTVRRMLDDLTAAADLIEKKYKPYQPKMTFIPKESSQESSEDVSAAAAGNTPAPVPSPVDDDASRKTAVKEPPVAKTVEIRIPPAPVPQPFVKKDIPAQAPVKAVPPVPAQAEIKMKLPASETVQQKTKIELPAREEKQKVSPLKTPASSDVPRNPEVKKNDAQGPVPLKKEAPPKPAVPKTFVRKPFLGGALKKIFARKEHPLKAPAARELPKEALPRPEAPRKPALMKESEKKVFTFKPAVRHKAAAAEKPVPRPAPVAKKTPRQTSARKNPVKEALNKIFTKKSPVKRSRDYEDLHLPPDIRQP